MANSTSAQPAPQTDQEYEAEFELLMQEATRLIEMMNDNRPDSDRAEIERLRIETRMLRDDTRTMLSIIEANQQAYREHHDRDMAARDREKLILRLENQRLRAERVCRRGARE